MDLCLVLYLILCIFFLILNNDDKELSSCSSKSVILSDIFSSSEENESDNEEKDKSSLFNTLLISVLGLSFFSFKIKNEGFTGFFRGFNVGLNARLGISAIHKWWTWYCL